ncbi:MAG: CoA transferase, partial [Deltaproteobacteria bacterium]|nr:CoA transferase [Deltaproteobacteria bacterium]
MSQALEDVTVVDLTSQFWSSLTGAFLADFGATVIRVDLLPQAQEKAQEKAPEKIAEGSWDHDADLVHRNKRSVALNLEDEAGRKLMKELIAKADVVVTDWMMADLEAAGLDYASVCKLREDIVYGPASGFGPKGPDKDLPAIDELAAA